MDLETENRIATILLKEASELRRRAEKEGVEVYLRQPQLRPNSRFLTATVLGVQQANRAVEENEMWRARQKEIDLDDQRGGKSRIRSGRYDKSYRSNRDYCTTSTKHSDIEEDVSESPTCSSRERVDVGLRDDEVENFLQSRIKRGRGAVGSRMDETGPYLPSDPDTKGKQATPLDLDHRGEGPQQRVMVGPERPPSFLCSESSEDESSGEQKKKRMRRHCSRKHRSKDKLREKEKEKKKKKKQKTKHKSRKYLE